MPVPNGYDLGLQHAAVNGGGVVGFLLDERNDDAWTEDHALVAHVDISTGGVASVASYGLGARTYRARVTLRSDVHTRAHRAASASPDALRALLLLFAATTDGATTLHLPTGDRYVAFTDALRFTSSPNEDGFVALLTMTDVGPA
jgi:hypothetical protein